MIVLLFILLWMCADAATRCFMNKAIAPPPLPGLCGCTGISPSLNVLFNVILPPHTGTGATTTILDQLVKVKSCFHDHVCLSLHQEQLSAVSGYCEKQTSPVSSNVQSDTTSRSIDGVKLCETASKKEFLAITARNPF